MHLDASLITLERLDLVLFDAPVLSDLVAGRREHAAARLGASVPASWPDEHDARFLRLRLEQVEREPATSEWLVRGVVLRETEQLVGHAGFHGPPGVNGLRDPTAVEIGYTIFSEYRGLGYAVEAARGLVAWAWERGVGTVLASVSPSNEPSLAIVRKLGFGQVGEQWDDEDGLELVFALAT